MKRRGVLIVNLGTPKSEKPKDVFRYLNEFLTDARVIDFPWVKRQFLVRGLIVPFRYKQSARQYAHIWTEVGSPLLHWGKRVEEELQKSLGENYRVVLAMRYQQPSITDGLEFLRKNQIDELIVLPLFPQYASATTGSVTEYVMQSLKNWRTFPKLIFINHFFDHPGLIDAFCSRAKQYPLSSYDHFLFSFHGLPQRHIREGDTSGCCLGKNCCAALSQKNRGCYRAQCFATARAIGNQLGLQENQTTVCFQSRLGKEPWLQPYTSDEIQASAKRGCKKLLVFSPSFVCDCLETIYEISIESSHEFKKSGGVELQLVEGLNSHPVWINALKTIVLENQTA